MQTLQSGSPWLWLHACVHLCVCAARRAPFQSEKLVPSAKLTAVHIPLRPAEAVLAPLPGKRDALPNNRTIHTLLLTYKLTVTEAGKHTITLPLLNRSSLSPAAASIQ